MTAELAYTYLGVICNPVYVLRLLQVIGPVLVEVDAPTFLGDISLSVQQKDGVEYLIAEWDRLSFEANEVKDGLLYSISYAVGKYLRPRTKLNLNLATICLSCF